MGINSGPAEGHQRLFSVADEPRHWTDRQEMRKPDSRDLLLLVTLLLTLVSGHVAAHEIAHSPPVVSLAELGLIASASIMTLFSVTAMAKLVARERTTGNPPVNWATEADS